MGNQQSGIMLSSFRTTSRSVAVRSLPRVSFSTAPSNVSSFVEKHLSQNGFDAPTIASETECILSGGIISMSVMQQLTSDDWAGLGLKVGSSRVLQNALTSEAEGSPLARPESNFS